MAALLDLHPDCRLSRPDEDWLLAESWRLSEYAATLGRRWRANPEWHAPPDADTRLLRHLGDGLVAFLGEGSDGERIVGKTPSVDGLDRFFGLFPDAYLVILVRDGRSVVESASKSFGDDPAGLTRRWNGAAERILRFDRENRAHEHQYRIVRYEDLVRDPASKMAELLRFLGLDVARYDFSEIARMPVLGSSFTPNPGGKWKWEAAPATGDESFIERWSGWTRGQHERFNRIAGDELEALGYAPVRFTTGRLLWRVLTALDPVAELPRRAARLLRFGPR